jgi:hypothetical protein
MSVSNIIIAINAIFIKPNWAACQPTHVRISTVFVFSQNPQIYENKDYNLIPLEPVSNLSYSFKFSDMHCKSRLLPTCCLSALWITKLHKHSGTGQPLIHCTVPMFVNLTCSKCWPFMVTHFHTTVLPFHDQVHRIMMRPHDSQVCFPYFPATAHITHSSVQLSLSLSEIHYFCTLWNETLFQPSNIFYLQKVLVYD